MDKVWMAFLLVSSSENIDMYIIRKIKGFTLLELLVVMVIIGLLVGYVGPKYFNQLGKSEVKAAKAQIYAFDQALDQYRLDVGHYPQESEGLGALLKNATNQLNWGGPYLKKQPPLDPWGKAYVYRYPGQENEFDLISYGSDGKPGGVDNATDISN